MNDFYLYIVVFCQQLLLLLSSYFFVNKISAEKRTRLIVSFLMGLFFLPYAYAHGIYSEGLWVSWAIFQVVITITLVRQEKICPFHATLFVIVFMLGGLTRHMHKVLIALPILLIFFSGRSHWKKLLPIGSLCLLSLLLLNAASQVAAAYGGFQYRSISGRANIYRIAALDWDHMPAERKTEIILQVQNQTEDPLVKKGVELVAQKISSWEDVWVLLFGLVREEDPSASFEQKSANTDTLLLKICQLYLKSPIPELRKAILKDFNSYLHYGAGDLLADIIFTTRGSLYLFESGSPFDIAVKQVKGVQNWKNLDDKNTTLINFFKKVNFLPVALLSSLSLLIVLVSKGRRENISVVLSFLSLTLMSAFFLSIISIVVPRYGLLHMLLGEFALAFAVKSFLDQPRSA